MSDVPTETVQRSDRTERLLAMAILWMVLAPVATCLAEIHGSVAEAGVRAELATLRSGDASLETLDGVVVQTATISGEHPDGGVQEWFLETVDGRTVAVAVSASAATSAPRSGTRITILGRRIGELESVGRDRIQRRWPLWVGSPVSQVQVTSDRMAVIIGVATLVAALGWIVLRLLLRKRSKVVVGGTVGTGRSRRAEEAGVVAGTGDIESLADAVNDFGDFGGE